MQLFLADLNQLNIWAIDIINAYLEGKISKKVSIIIGNEFGERESFTLIIHKSLYGFCSSRNIWRSTLSDDLYDMEFKPCKVYIYG